VLEVRARSSPVRSSGIPLTPATDTPYHDRLDLKSSSDRFLALSALPPIITLDHADPNSSMGNDDGDGADGAEVLMVTGDSMLRISLDVEKVQAFKAE
jgi:hypothetical protein